MPQQFICRNCGASVYAVTRISGGRRFSYWKHAAPTECRLAVAMPRGNRSIEFLSPPPRKALLMS